MDRTMKHLKIREASEEPLILLELQKIVEEKYSEKFGDYWEFHTWSVDNFEKFWEEVWNFLGIISSKPFDKVIAPYKSIEDVPEWFPGSRMNYAENMLRHDSGTALIIFGEENPVPTKISYQNLREQTSVLTAAFRKTGIKKNDVIACFMSNRLEAITSMLAAASVGALFAAANPLMGVRAVVNRFHQVKPKVLFTVDRHVCNGVEKNIMDILAEIVKSLPTLELVVIVPSKEESLNIDISVIPKSCFFPEFAKKGLDEDGRPPAPYYEQLPFSHPFIISFTSGTTGPPKGVVHSAGAVLIEPLKDLVLHFNVDKSDVIWTFYLVGWMTWNFYLASLATGATVVIYEGFPFYHSDCYWDVVERLGVTIAFLIPSVLEEMERRNIVPGPDNNLSKLKLLLSGSCHVKSHTFDFVYTRIKQGIYYTVGYGSTETMALVAGLAKCLPVYKEELQAPALGFGLNTLNEEGKIVVDTLGELVITKPFPTMPLYFWNDEGNQKYKSTFFEKYPGVFCHSDMCYISSNTGGLVVIGRTDETIKQRGVRFGSAEIYDVVNHLEEVSDSLCVSKRNELGDEIAVLFIKLKAGYSFTSKFVEMVREKIKMELSYRHVPEVIHQVKDIPYNVNGKRMEVLVKKILAHSPAIALDSVANLESLKEYQEFAKSS